MDTIDKPAAQSQIPDTARRGAHYVLGGSLLLLVSCWGLTTMTESLALYAAGWVVAVAGASSASLIYRVFTDGQPALRMRVRTMTLGLVGWLIVIGTVLIITRAIKSIFVGTQLMRLEWAVWLTPLAAALAGAIAVFAWHTGRSADYPPIKRHANDHLISALALAGAETALIISRSMEARWPDVVFAVLIGLAGLGWSALQLWRRLGPAEPAPAPEPAPEIQNEPDAQ